MKLILISPPKNIAHEHSIVEAILKSGLEDFHLRKPDFSYEEMELYIRQISVEFRSKIILHSHHQLAIGNKLKGVHYTSSNPFEEEKAFPENIQESASFHSLDELKAINPRFKYVFLSPIFDSISKNDLKAKFEKEDLYNALEAKESNTEVIALGGINEDTVYDTLEIGFDGVAVLGIVWQANNPLKAYSQMAEIREAIIELADLFNE